ncbi:MAG: hypothetical protein DYH12_17905, partial [Sorangiineae bacterium PRO1]|nr:hypothetical protein [Sorangiineae bacterium PRO1]
MDALADELRAHKQGHQADLKGPLFQQGISTPEAFAGVKVETVERVVAPPTTAGAPRQTAPAEPASLAPSSGLSEPALRRVAPRPELLSPEPQGALFEVLTQIQHDLHELRSRIVAEPPKVVPQWLRAAAQN